MALWKKAGISYLKYANIGAAAIRSVLKEDAKAIAMKRAEIALKRTIWKDGRIAESKMVE